MNPWNFAKETIKIIVPNELKTTDIFINMYQDMYIEQFLRYVEFVKQTRYMGISDVD